MKKWCAYTLLLIAYAQFAFAQQGKLDSLRETVQTGAADTNKVNALNALTKNAWQTGVYDTALIYAILAKELSDKLNFKKGGSAALNNMGITYWRQGNYPEALKNYFSALKIAEEMGDKRKMAAIYGNIGNIYINQGELDQALTYQLLDVKLATEKGDKKLLGNAYNSIANIYFRQSGLPNISASRYDSLMDLAVKNYLIAWKLNEETGNMISLAHNHNNLGLLYETQGNRFAKEGNKNAAGKKFAEAKDMYLRGLELEEKTGDRESTAGSYINLGNLHTTLRQYMLADKYLDSALSISKEIGNLEDLKDTYYHLQKKDSAVGDYRAAYQHYKEFVANRDSLLNAENTRKSVQTQMNYEFGKKEAAVKAEQGKKDAIAAEEKRKKNLFLLLIAVVATAVAIIAAVIFRSLRTTRKQKQIIEVQKAEVERSKSVIEEKNKDITDSITYAMRIQQAKLPARSEISAAFPDSFVLFKPKDIVSGDFYYFHKNHSSLFIAAADCTGHGVPGAFMSMIGSEKLDDALAHNTNPSEILAHLNAGIKSSLKQSNDNESTRDGMDIALCSLDKNTLVLKYAGANRPLWIIRKGQPEVQEIKATKKAIGGFTDDGQFFETHTVQLERGDAFYIFSDGYADTFGGKTSKKLTTKKFRELLLSIREKSMTEQGEYLDTFIENWKGGTEQVDDVLVIGMRL